MVESTGHIQRGRLYLERRQVSHEKKFIMLEKSRPHLVSDGPSVSL